ncbi:MAG: universal stress protein [Chloroflexi bacterium]|nr:universal stress protein [Chloroflexota bacterium]
MYSKILVPLDSSELAEQALPHVIANAVAHRSAVHLLQVIDPADMTSPILRRTLEMLANVGEPDRSETLGAWEASAREYLESVAERLRDAGVGTVTSSVVRGNPFELVAQEAEAVGAELIVIASHGRSGLGRAVTGSVADHVIRETPNAAVLVIRPEPTE